MSSIITGFNTSLPSQNRIRIAINHAAGSCIAFFDFNLDSNLYDLKWFYVDTPADLFQTSPRSQVQVGYNRKIGLQITTTATNEVAFHEVWTPPYNYVNFRFDWPEDHACWDGHPGSTGFYNYRYYVGDLYVATVEMDRRDSIVVVYTRDTQAITCEDVGMFYSVDGTDPAPCVTNPCFAVDEPLTNILVNYEVLTVRTGTLVNLSGRSVDTQGDSGNSCGENCNESIDGSGWMF